MTQEARTTKNFYRLNGGLNTEINELNFPDGFSRDEANYELLVDGSRRRRKGLAVESGAGSAKTVTTFATGEKCQSYVWRNVGGNPDKTVVVFRKGNTLYFADADETVSDGWASGSGSYINTEDFETSGATTANTDNASFSFSSGRGYLFVTGPYTRSFYVTYEASTGEYSANEINILMRDFADVEDGEHYAKQPTTITDDHRYNLRNRGWTQDDIEQYFTDEAKYPPKNALWYKGYKRTYGASVAEQDGTRSWDSTKMAAEPFGSSSAPVGSLFIEPYDTTFGYGIAGAGADAVAITTWSYLDNGSDWTVTLTTASAHGINIGEEFVIQGNWMTYNTELVAGEPITKGKSMDGQHTAISGTAGSSLVFTWTSEPNQVDSWESQYEQLGSVDTGLSLTRSIGTAHDDSFNAIEFHAGRVFYAGMKNAEFSDTILFSQIAQTTDKFGRCYQEADPTDETFNALTSADGGTIVIPGMGGVVNLVSVRNSLIVLAREGVWEISGGNRGVFTADGYSVRKISDSGCFSPDGWAKVEGAVVYTGPGGIYIVSPNQFTGLLEANSATENTIQTLWNQIPDAEQKNISVVYDSALKRMYFLYGSDGSTTIGIDTMLIFDSRAAAWFKYTFDTPTNNVLLCGFAIPNADDTSDNKKMKFIYQASTTSVQVADFDQTDFNDWDGTNGPLPYIVFGHDGLGDWQRRKQAPVITVFAKRTETGYTDTGNGWDPVNESSTLLTPYWDWTDDSVSGKVGTQRETYRHVRQFVPSGAGDVSGYPVVVTRNKIRGRGRSLQLRFDGDTDKDSHILGFQVNFKITRKI